MTFHTTCGRRRGIFLGNLGAYFAWSWRYMAASVGYGAVGCFSTSEVRKESGHCSLAIAKLRDFFSALCPRGI